MRDWDNVLSFLSDKINTSRERRSIIETFVPDLVNEGINQTQSLNLFRRNGMGIRSSDFSEIYQKYSRRNELYTEIRLLDFDDEIAENLMQRSTSLNDNKYRWVANAGYIDDDENTFFLDSFSISSNTNMSIHEVTEAIRSTIIEIYQVKPEHIQNIQITRAYVNILPFE